MVDDLVHRRQLSVEAGSARSRAVVGVAGTSSAPQMSQTTFTARGTRHDVIDMLVVDRADASAGKARHEQVQRDLDVERRADETCPRGPACHRAPRPGPPCGGSRRGWRRRRHRPRRGAGPPSRRRCRRAPGRPIRRTCGPSAPSGSSPLSAARKSSPVEICGRLSVLARRSAWVPLPAPGAPSITMMRRLPPGRRRHVCGSDGCHLMNPS